MCYCDSCNTGMKQDDMFALSPRYDCPTGPRDVSRVYCRSWRRSGSSRNSTTTRP